uniref:protein-serine/threonine phosphatase n=1 Tax=Araucaria cunninghamii TaxID=56994 RepID=A0A0D6R2E2_ARACU
MAAGAEVPQPVRAVISGRENGFCMINGNNSDGDSGERHREVTGRPPRPLAGIRHCVSTARLPGSSDSELELDAKNLLPKSSAEIGNTFEPVFRSGSWAEKGPKRDMEDEHICIDDLQQHLGSVVEFQASGAFYGVFDGHGGRDAALFIQKNLLKYIVEDSHFPKAVGKALRNAFMQADNAFADAVCVDSTSGTTALAALIVGRTMTVANAGDCRAVLGKRGKAIEMSTDHKPNCNSERLRIESLGGSVYDGYLNGQLSVARALGDWHMKGPKGSKCPLSAEPEVKEVELTEEDEFLIIGCDGLWDVMTSQCAVTLVRRALMAHNDPERCSKELVREALDRNTCDNLTVVVICFSADPPPRIEHSRSRLFRRSISAEGLNNLRGYIDCPLRN